MDALDIRSSKEKVMMQSSREVPWAADDDSSNTEGHCDHGLTESEPID